MSTLKVAVSSADHHLGNVNAGITLVEYGDFECSHCRLAHPLIKRLLKEKGDGLQFVFRHFPLREAHPHAYISAIAAEAAGKQGKFWEMHDRIFENQEKLTLNFLRALARYIGLQMEQYEEDSNSKEIKEKIENDFESGIRSGVNGTPTFFTNGIRISSYNETYESLLNAIQYVPSDHSAD